MSASIPCLIAEGSRSVGSMKVLDDVCDRLAIYMEKRMKELMSENLELCIKNLEFLIDNRLASFRHHEEQSNKRTPDSAAAYSSSSLVLISDRKRLPADEEDRGAVDKEATMIINDSREFHLQPSRQKKL
jgi:hypothetical protein